MHPQLAIGFGAHSHDKLAEEWTRRRKRRRRRRNWAFVNLETHIWQVGKRGIKAKKNGRGSKTSQRPFCHKAAARGTRCRRCRDQENPTACIGSRPEAGQVGNGGAASAGGAIARCEMVELELELQEEKRQHGLEAEAPEVTTSSSQSPPFA